MITQWQKKTLALTPETEQERALLEVMAAAHRPNDWTPTPPSGEPTTREEVSSQRPRS